MTPLPPSVEVRQQLDRILSSDPFARAEQLSRFLKFTVEAVLDGRESEIKESVLGVEVFGRGAYFDPRSDPIVRVTARKIRAKLDEYYSNAGRADRLIIEIPKGGYVPQFRPVSETDEAGAPPVHTRRRWIAAVAALGALAVGVALWLQTSDTRLDPIQLTRFADHADTEFNPVFSPDGRSVAHHQFNAVENQLVLTQLESGRRLTLAKGPNMALPFWTADGTRVCFHVPDGSECVSAAGGPPAVLMKRAGSSQFTPDGSSLLFLRRVNGRPVVFVSSPPGSEPHPVEGLTLPDESISRIRLSRDGTKLMAGRSGGSPAGYWVIPYPRGTPRRVPEEEGWTIMQAGDWFPDNRHVVLIEQSEGPAPGFRLVIADTESPARRLVLIDRGMVNAAALSPDGKRILFASMAQEGINVTEFSTEGKRIRTLATQAFEAEWSRSGERFIYRQSGVGRTPSVWTRLADGSSPSALQPHAPLAHDARYSPDGQRLTYVTGGLGGTPGLETMPAAGGQSTRVLTGKGVIASSCWSADGEWLYYTQERALRKVSSRGGGAPVEVRKSASPDLICSPDGSALLWVAGDQVHVLALATENERVIDPKRSYLGRGAFSQDGGLAYLVWRDRRNRVDVLDVARGKVLRSIELDLLPIESIAWMSVHPDGKRLLISAGGPPFDVWSVEGFAQPAAGWRRWFGHWIVHPASHL